MSGPFPSELKQRVKKPNTVDDQRQYDQSSVKSKFAETHRGIGKDGKKAGSK